VIGEALHWEYAAIGYVVVLGGLAAYAGAILRRGRRLSRQVPEQDRRYLG
jgi:hypothetical protein